MPSFSSFTLNDGATTPVTHTFSPLTLMGMEAKYADRSSGITVGYPTVLIQNQVPGKQSKLSKVRAKVTVPILEVVNSSTYSGITPAPTKAYEVTAEVVFIMPERCTLLDRKHLLAFTKNLIASDLMIDLVQTQESIY